MYGYSVFAAKFVIKNTLWRLAVFTISVLFSYILKLEIRSVKRGSICPIATLYSLAAAYKGSI